MFSGDNDRANRDTPPHYGNNHLFEIICMSGKATLFSTCCLSAARCRMPLLYVFSSDNQSEP
jgi:hypothetical protein